MAPQVRRSSRERPNEFFDLESDADELVDLAEVRPELASELHRQLWRFQHRWARALHVSSPVRSRPRRHAEVTDIGTLAEQARETLNRSIDVARVGVPAIPPRRRGPRFPDRRARELLRMTPSHRIRASRRGLLRAYPCSAILASLLGLVPGGRSADAATAVTIAPAEGQTSLRAGDNVKVSWSGMPPGPVSIYQCADPAYLESRGLAVTDSCQLSSRVIGETGPDGTGSADFQLWWTMKSPQTDSIYCHDSPRCVVRVASCAHTPEPSGGYAVIPGMTLDEDPDTGDLKLPARYKFKRPRPAVPEVVLPTPKPTDRPKVNGAGGTGIQLAVESWRAGSLAGPVGVDATYAPRFFDEGYKFVVEGSNDYAISSVPLRGDLMAFEDNFAPFEELDPNMNAEQQRQLWDKISGDLIYVPLVASSLDVIFDIAPFGVEHEQLNIDGRSLARMFGGGTSEVTAIDSWNDAAITEQNALCPPVGRFLGSFAGETGNVVADESGLARRSPVRATNRSDSSESNFVLREWLGRAPPTFRVARTRRAPRPSRMRGSARSR